MREVFPGWVPLYREIPSLATKDFRAISEFLNGQIAFGRDAWAVAGNHFESALAIDSTFAQAAWRLADTRRWQRIPTDIDLAQVYAAHKADFGPLDTLLITAQLEPDLAKRRTIYARADSLYPHDFYAKFVYGNELFHRGPLSGLPLEYALNTMEAARALNPRFGPVLNQVAWAYIRLGRRNEAARVVAQRDSIGTPPGGELDVGRQLGLAYLYRFARDSAAALEPRLLANPDTSFITELSRVVRLALSFDVPDAQLRLGGWLADAPGAPPLQHASGHTAQGLASIALGVRSMALCISILRSACHPPMRPASKPMSGVCCFRRRRRHPARSGDAQRSPSTGSAGLGWPSRCPGGMGTGNRCVHQERCCEHWMRGTPEPDSMLVRTRHHCDWSRSSRPCVTRSREITRVPWNCRDRCSPPILQTG